MEETPQSASTPPAQPSQAPPTQLSPSQSPASSAGYPQKAPVLAAFLSILPGLGNVYNGLYKRAILLFAIFVSFFAIAIESGEGTHLGFLVPCIIFVWFFSIFDAYRQATLINYGMRSDVDEARLDMAGWGLAPGVFLLVLGLYGLLRGYFDIEWDWLIDQWPWAVMVLGAWMIFQHFKERSGAVVGSAEEAEA